MAWVSKGRCNRSAPNLHAVPLVASRGGVVGNSLLACWALIGDWAPKLTQRLLLCSCLKIPWPGFSLWQSGYLNRLCRPAHFPPSLSLLQPKPSSSDSATLIVDNPFNSAPFIQPRCFLVSLDFFLESHLESESQGSAVATSWPCRRFIQILCPSTGKADTTFKFSSAQPFDAAPDRQPHFIHIETWR